MTQRYQRIKDEIMHTFNRTPYATYSISGLHERLKDRITRAEIDRAVACLLSRQHIKKMARHIYGLGNKGETKPYDLSNYKHDALPAITEPEKSKKQQIADAEEKRRQQSAGRKTMQDWSRGNKPPHVTLGDEPPAEKPPAPPAPTPKDTVIASEAKQSILSAENNGRDRQASINQSLANVRQKLGRYQVKDMPIKINVLEQLADAIGDPDIASVLNDIKNDLQQGEAA